MTLYRRGQRWWVYLWVDGIRYAKATGTSSRRQAEAVERQFRDELTLRRHGLTQVDPQMPFAVLAGRFLAEGSPKPYHFDRLKLLLPFFGEIQIGSITKNSARQFRAYRQGQRKLTATTINRDLEALRNILNWALDEGLLAANPLSRMRLERERRKRRPVISVQEEEALLAAASPHLGKIISAALATGMRRGELLTQRWEDVDFERRLLFVSHSKTPEGEAREIPLASRLYDQLNTNRASDGLVFTFHGEPIHSLKTAWKTALRKSGIRQLRFHDLRHSFASRMVEAGVIREVRMALMGHSTGEDVHSLYCHVELPAKREAIRKLAEWVNAQLNKKGGTANEGIEPGPDQAIDPDPGYRGSE